MLPPVWGGGPRRSRRPWPLRSLLILFLVSSQFVLRFSPSTLAFDLSESHSRVRSSTSTLSSPMTVSPGKTEGHSLPVTSGGRKTHPTHAPHWAKVGFILIRSVTCSSLSPFVPSICDLSFVSTVPHLNFSNRLEMTAYFPSGSVASLKNQFKPRCVSLPFEGFWPNLHRLDDVSMSGVCFAVFSGVIRRHSFPIFDRALHRLRTVFVTRCEVLVLTCLVSYGMILRPHRPPDDLLMTISVSGEPPCLAKSSTSNSAAHGTRGKLGQPLRIGLGPGIKMNVILLSPLGYGNPRNNRKWAELNSYIWVWFSICFSEIVSLTLVFVKLLSGKIGGIDRGRRPVYIETHKL